MERATLHGGKAFGGQLASAVNQPCRFGAIFHGLSGDFVIVGLIRLTEVGGVRVRHRAFKLHPVKGSAGVQATRKSDSDLLADREILKNGGHGVCSAVVDSLRF